MKNNTIKAFDYFISHNFFGYSAHTLYQELCHSYPGEVFGLTPVPGYERVAPDDKRMRCDKFTTFA